MVGFYRQVASAGEGRGLPKVDLMINEELTRDGSVLALWRPPTVCGTADGGTVTIVASERYSKKSANVYVADDGSRWWGDGAGLLTPEPEVSTVGGAA